MAEVRKNNVLLDQVSRLLTHSELNRWFAECDLSNAECFKYFRDSFIADCKRLDGNVVGKKNNSISPTTIIRLYLGTEPHDELKKIKLPDAIKEYVQVEALKKFDFKNVNEMEIFFSTSGKSIGERDKSSHKQLWDKRLRCVADNMIVGDELGDLYKSVKSFRSTLNGQYVERYVETLKVTKTIDEKLKFMNIIRE